MKVNKSLRTGRLTPAPWFCCKKGVWDEREKSFDFFTGNFLHCDRNYLLAHRDVVKPLRGEQKCSLI